MHVAFFLSHYPSPGGTTTAVDGLASGLEKLGHRITILCDTDSTDRRKRSSRAIVAVDAPSVIRKKRSQVSTENTLDCLGIDLLVLNGMFHPQLPPLAAAARRIGLPYVVAPHGAYHPNSFRSRRLTKRLYFSFFERKLLESAAAIQVLAFPHVGFLRDTGIDTATFVLPHGIGTDAVPVVSYSPTDRITIGYLGRMASWQKGLDLLIGAFGEVARRDSRLHLILKGPATAESDSLTRLVSRLRLEERVSFAGPDRRSFTESLDGFDVLALSSRYEGFGLTVLEAMATGRPVLCSTQAGIAEHVAEAHCGVLVDPTRESIAEGLRQLSAKPDRFPELGSSGRRYVDANLRWDRIAQRAQIEYERIAGSGKVA